MPDDLKDQEDAYFRKADQERLAKLKEREDAMAKVASAEQLKALHYFRCGKCGNHMETLVFRGVEVERCGTCGAVLLDPGELEKLVGPDKSFSMALKDFFTLSRRTSG